MESATSLFRTSWNTYKANWQLLTLIAAVPSVLLLIGGFLITTETVGGFVAGPLLSIAGFVFTIAMQAACVIAIQKIDAGEIAAFSWKKAYSAGFGLFWPLVLAMIIQILVTIGATALFIIPVIVVGVYSSFYVFALVADGMKGRAAFVGSFSVVYKRWWHVLAKLLLPAAVYVLASFIVTGIEYLIVGTPNPGASGTHTTGPISSILSMIVNIVLGPVFVVYMYRLYGQLKATRVENAPLSTFRMWLMILLVIGILGIIIGPALILGILAAHVPLPVVH